MNEMGKTELELYWLYLTSLVDKLPMLDLQWSAQTKRLWMKCYSSYWNEAIRLSRIEDQQEHKANE